ncbi:MAG: UDP-N-acetylmuramate--L-alanine ligase [Bacteroidota bacterium]
MSGTKQARKLKVIVSGGGTGGHIFPAIAIADELRRLRPETEFLFVGAEGKMEMEKVPAAGYRIVGLPIRGLQRRLSLANLSFPFRLLSSLWKSRQIIKDFKPDLVIGTGGYAGGPILYVAAKLGVPTLIQEPNAFAGLANKWVGRFVDKICVAFPDMEKYFPADKLVITGNPVRETLLQSAIREDATHRQNAYHILLMGGSGGARSLNEALRDSTELMASRPNIHWTWQSGKHYYETFKDCATAQLPNVKIAAFLHEMDEEYRRADVVIGRAGSTTIAEIQYLGKPTILVPSPWVTEDHQTMNAKALTERQAALLVPDAEVTDRLVQVVHDLIDQPEKRAQLGQNAQKMAQTGAVTRIAEEALQLIGELTTTSTSPPVETARPSISKAPSKVYFIGIGGIGMSALARYYNRRGMEVAGYDRTETPLTKALVAEGIKVHYTPQPDQLPLPKTEAAQGETLFVYTPAVPQDFPELVALRERQVPVYKRSEVLGMISRDKQTIAIAGTHGKTTTTTLTTHLLRACGVATSAFLGGIARNFAGNYVHGESDWVTVEADEYDRSFLRLFPQQAVILSMDADHLDIYGDHENMLETGFKAFASQVNHGGVLLVRHDLLSHFDYTGPSTTKAASNYGLGAKQVKLLSFSSNGKGDYHSHNIRVEDGMFTFDFGLPNGEVIHGLKLPLPGRHNVENATAAIAMTLEAGGDIRQLKDALLSFKGIARRFETVLRSPEVVIIDDYAHHPTELTAAITAARELYPNQTIRGVFQPHLFSRTNDFADGFAAALDLLDDAILLPIYPAREEPIPGVTSELILRKMKSTKKELVEKEDLLESLSSRHKGVLLMLGAGDIDALVPAVVGQYTKMLTHD